MNPQFSVAIGRIGSANEVCIIFCYRPLSYSASPNSQFSLRLGWVRDLRLLAANFTSGTLFFCPAELTGLDVKSNFWKLKISNNKRTKSAEINRFQRIFGPSDRVRTCGLMVPNHPRYQLRYTRIFTFRFLEISLSVVKAVVKCNFGVHFNGRSNPAIDRVPRASGVSVSHGSDIGTALPKCLQELLRISTVQLQYYLQQLFYYPQ